MLYDVLGSATAGIISRIFTHPLDTVKARLQATNSFRSPLDALVRTYKQEGFRALYGGFGAVIVGGTPGTILYLTGYGFFKDFISSAVSDWNDGEVGHDATVSSNTHYDRSKPQLSHGKEFAVHFMSGMLAEAVTCIIYVPVDVIKERMQVQQIKGNASAYNSSWDALRKIRQTEGTRGIYKGYGATLASFGLFSALYFMFYEQCKSLSREYISNRRENDDFNMQKNNELVKVKDGNLPFLHLIASSGAAGALASFLTSPIDMAKLRLQVQRGQTAKAGGLNATQTTHYRGMLDCLHVAYRDGGIRGLFRGAGARVIHFAPATTITMTLYEKCRCFYADALG